MDSQHIHTTGHSTTEHNPTQHNRIDDQNKENRDVQERLTSERRRNKELAATVQKFQSQVQLLEEQGRVYHLKVQTERANQAAR